MMQQEAWRVTGIAAAPRPPAKSAPCSPVKPLLQPQHSLPADSFHVARKVPAGDTPYVKAKRVQLLDKDPEKAIALFWAAINAGDRVDSALKDMAIVMKQQNRAEEAIEAIKSLRHRCSDQSQESLDNILLDLYKRCGRLDEQIALLKHKLQLIQQGLAFNGKRTKTARSQGRKFQVTLEQEATRLLGNLGWALMQKDSYAEAEAAYRRALLIGPDNNKMCNLGICLMKQGRVLEAKEMLKKVGPAAIDSLRGAESHLKAFDRAQEMLQDLETKISGNPGRDQRWLFEALFGASSSIWRPQPCIDYAMPPPRSDRDHFPNENVDVSRALNVAAQPFYSTKMAAQQHDHLGNLKRTRSGNAALQPRQAEEKKEVESRRKSLAAEEWPGLPDCEAFDEALIAAVIAPVLEEEDGKSKTVEGSPVVGEGKTGKRLRIFQDITQTLHAAY